MELHIRGLKMLASWSAVVAQPRALNSAGKELDETECRKHQRLIHALEIDERQWQVEASCEHQAKEIRVPEWSIDTWLRA